MIVFVSRARACNKKRACGDYERQAKSPERWPKLAKHSPVLSCFPCRMQVEFWAQQPFAKPTTLAYDEAATREEGAPRLAPKPTLCASGGPMKVSLHEGFGFRLGKQLTHISHSELAGTRYFKPCAKQACLAPQVQD